MSRGECGHRLLLILPVLYLALALTGWSRAPVHDEIRYLDLAARAAPGVKAPVGELSLRLNPGYGLFLSPFVAMRLNHGLLRVLNAALLFGAVVCFRRFLLNVVTPLRALAGAWLLGLYFPLWKHLPMLMSEILAVCLVCFALWSWSEVLRAEPRRWGWMIAAAFGLAGLCLTRVIFGYVTLACGLFWLVLALARRTRRGPSRLAVVHILALFLCLPWLCVTYTKTHRFFCWSSSGGLSLYWMTTPFPGEWGDWHAPENVLTNGRMVHHRPVFEAAEKLPEGERDATYKQAAMRNLRERPLRYAVNLAANVSRMFFSFPYTHTPQKLSTLFYVLPNALLLSLLLAGCAGLRRMTRAEAAAVFPYALFGAAGFAGSALLSAYARMLFPLVPVILLIILYGLRRSRLSDLEATHPEP